MDLNSVGCRLCADRAKYDKNMNNETKIANLTKITKIPSFTAASTIKNP